MALTVGLPTYFGKEHIGSISGVYYSVRLCAGAVGPALFGVLFDAWGDFRPVMLGALALPGVALLATCFLPRYPQPLTGGFRGRERP